MMRLIRSTDWLEMAGGMREIQRNALLALTADATPLPTLQRLSQMKMTGMAFERDGELVAIAGSIPVHPGVESTFLYATDDFPKVILEVTHFFKTLFGVLKTFEGVHRVHSLGPANDPGGIAWKERLLGAWPEAHLEKYGKNGEDFVLHTVML